MSKTSVTADTVCYSYYKQSITSTLLFTGRKLRAEEKGFKNLTADIHTWRRISIRRERCCNFSACDDSSAAEPHSQYMSTYFSVATRLLAVHNQAVAPRRVCTSDMSIRLPHFPLRRCLIAALRFRPSSGMSCSLLRHPWWGAEDWSRSVTSAEVTNEINARLIKVRRKALLLKPWIQKTGQQRCASTGWLNVRLWKCSVKE